MTQLNAALDAVRAINIPSERAEFRRELTRILRDWDAQPAKDEAVADVIGDLQETGQLPKPEASQEAPETVDEIDEIPEWVNPGTLHSKMYRFGDVVRYGDRVVRSTHRGLNHWEPGTLGFDGRIWVDITPAPEPEPELPVEEDGDTEQPEPVEPEAPATPEWEVGKAYEAGDTILYEGVVYEVLQQHTSAAHWAPNAVASLYKAAA